MKRIQSNLNEKILEREKQIIEAIKNYKDKDGNAIFCPNILKYEDFFVNDDYTYIITESVPVKSLFLFK